MNYSILHYVLHYSLQPRDAQGHPGTRHTDKSRSSRYRDIGNLAVAIAISGK